MAAKFITVSIDIMHDTNLSMSQKFILAEIEQLSSLEDGCHAHNKHFSQLIGIGSATVTRAISGLVELGYVEVKYEPGSRNHIRMISLIKMIRPPNQNDQTPSSKRLETKGNIQVNIHSNIQQGVSDKAFRLWLDYKGNKYSATQQTVSQNKLKKFDEPTQIEMVETSIMNGWKGLFELKQQKSSDPQVKFENFMDMKEHLSANFEEYKLIDIEFEHHVWRIGKTGIAYSKHNIDDMPYDQRKRFWIYMIANRELLSVPV